jgi:ribonuclease Y
MSPTLGVILLVCGIAALVAAAAVYTRARKEGASAKAERESILRLREQSERELEARKKEAILEAKDEAHRLRQEAEQAERDRRAELQRVERRLDQREESLDRRLEGLETRERQLATREQESARFQEEVQALLVRQRDELERIGGMTTDQARSFLLKQVEDEVRMDAARLIKQVEDETKSEANRKAREILVSAIQRCAVDQVSETTVSVVPLPSDDMKGRIIGREGRNIRAFETLTGVDLIIDDTPEAVVLSGFDPIRRETARLALSSLISDGRIHPGRIEESINRARSEVEAKIREAGELAVLRANVTGLHPELVRVLGKLKYRTSYGQNVLDHSVEVAHLAAGIAAELGANVNVARRAGLLHDLGKAIDYEVEGSHVQISIDLATRYGESAEVVHAIAAHHGDIEFQSVEAVLVHTADVISASRPGARREMLETYVKRVQKLENVADSFEGVEKTYAVQAGREIRIIAKPTDIDDFAAAKLARDIAKKIEEELEYPGQIKVVVIRETRSVEYAK